MIQKPSLEKASKQWLKYKESADKAISEGNYDLSESVLFAALTEAQEYFEETDYQLIYTLEKLVQSLWFLGRFDEAIEHCQKLVDIHERHPEELEPVNRLAYTINLAMVNHAARQFDQGDRYYLDAFNLAKKVFGTEHIIVEKIRGLHADLLDKAGYTEKMQSLHIEPKVITTSDWLPSEVLKMIKDSLGSPAATPACSSPPSPPQGQPGGGIKLPPSSGASLPGSMMPPPPPDLSTAQNVSSAPPVEGKESSSRSASHQDDSAHGAPPIQQEPQVVDYGEGLPPVSATSTVVTPGPGEIAVCFSKAEAEAVFLSNQFTAKSNQESGDIEVAVLLQMINLKLLEQFEVKDDMLLETLDSLVQLKQQMGLTKDAVEYAKKAHELRIDLHGEGNIDVAHSANKLAGIYYSLGYLDEAVNLTEFCIKVYEDRLGAEHPSVASSLHNLATLYHVQKKYTKAEEKYKQCLELKNKIFGSNHPSTSRLLKSYAELLRETHREMEAEHMSTMAMGMITGSWKAISEEEIKEKEKQEAEEEANCENCKWPLKGQTTCQVCGHRPRKRPTTAFSDL